MRNDGSLKHPFILNARESLCVADTTGQKDKSDERGPMIFLVTIPFIRLMLIKITGSSNYNKERLETGSQNQKQTPIAL